jgi:PleD family two-component response regulator
MDSQPTIPILASHPVLGELTAFRLRLLDINPVVVPDVEGLHQQIAETLPHVILIDLDLATADALQVTEKLTSDEITSRIPVICMSGEGDLAKAEQAFSFGADDFLVIPYDPIVLEKKVAAAMAKADERRSQDAGFSAITTRTG